jgi:hypothetical protein
MLFTKHIAMHSSFETGTTNSLCGFTGSPLEHNCVSQYRFTTRFTPQISQSPSSSGDLSFTNSKVLSPFASTIENFRSHLPVIKDNLHIPGL